MGGGIKSKFKFPIPGRPGKKQQVPAISVSAPLSKAQRILGADGINTGSSRLTADPGRWETASTGGISISISESSASQATHDTVFEQEDGRKAHWEDESAIIPRHNRSAHGPGQKGLTTKRSAFTVGNDSRDNITSMSTRARRLSTSTIDTHYDATKMPLAISQQTSNSAMAKGVPTKVNELLDMNGTLAGTHTAKKNKPARLDLSRLRPKGYKSRNKNTPNLESAIDDTYDKRTSSFASRILESPMLSGSTDRRTPRHFGKQQFPTRQSPRSKGVTDATGLHQLYHHYEQMSFLSEGGLEEEVDQEQIPAQPEHDLDQQRPVSTFTHSLLAPLASPLPQGRDAHHGHSYSGSHDSRTTPSITDSSVGLQVHSVSRKEYAGSVSSRHTRTSKASPSIKSLLGSDRLQSSVLSLSDSSDDEAIEPTSSAPLSSRDSATRDIVARNPNFSPGQKNSNYLPGTMSPRKFTPSLNQVDEHHGGKSTSTAQKNRSPSSHTLLSSHSSMSTLTPIHHSSSAPDTRFWSGSTESVHIPESLHQSAHNVQQARALSQVAISGGAHHSALLRQNSTATSHFSHASDQLTPPLSPNSVEFYVKSRESLQRDAMANGSIEAYNARLMAVTKQEEMLLAALRQKRAKMRETVVPSGGEDGRSRKTRPSRHDPENTKKLDMNNGRSGTARPPLPKHQADSLLMSRPKGGSSSAIATSWGNFSEGDEHDSVREDSCDIDLPSTTSRSDITERTSTSATRSTASTTFDSQNDRGFLYLDQPADSASTAGSSVDFNITDFMDDSDGEDLIVNERRTSRMQFQNDGAHNMPPRYGASGADSRQEATKTSQRPNISVRTNVPRVSMNGRRPQDVPEVKVLPEYNEDIDADSLDGDILDEFLEPPAPPPSWPLPPRPERPSIKSDHSRTPVDFLHPSSARQPSQLPGNKTRHLKGKRSLARLSAVGQIDSATTWWSDKE
ncbi:hypothetical protein F4777DRAFT_114172 [Nemania sp. FL0916]|nr:hypothetical protein F4777DRAFT_114172 [Nemania sp. FL0916]